MKKLILLLALVSLVACRSNNTASTSQSSLAPHDSFSHFAGQSTFVFQPGGTASGITSTTWATLMTAMALSQGTKTILIDDSLGAAHATAGIFNMEGVTLSGTGPGNTLIVDDGSVWNTTLLHITNTLVVTSAPTTPIITATATETVISVEIGSAFKSTSATAFIHAVSGNAVIFSRSTSTIGDGTHPLITTDVSKTSILIGISGTSIAAHASAGAGTCLIRTDDTSTANATQDTGVTTFALMSAASRLAYTPADAGAWQVAPTLVSQALDSIAFRLQDAGLRP